MVAGLRCPSPLNFPHSLLCNCPRPPCSHPILPAICCLMPDQELKLCVGVWGIPGRVTRVPGWSLTGSLLHAFARPLDESWLGRGGHGAPTSQGLGARVLGHRKLTRVRGREGSENDRSLLPLKTPDSTLSYFPIASCGPTGGCSPAHPSS
jgi:hypothetical protein